MFSSSPAPSEPEDLSRPPVAASSSFFDQVKRLSLRQMFETPPQKVEPVTTAPSNTLPNTVTPAVSQSPPISPSNLSLVLPSNSGTAPTATSDSTDLSTPREHSQIPEKRNRAAMHVSTLDLQNIRSRVTVSDDVYLPPPTVPSRVVPPMSHAAPPLSARLFGFDFGALTSRGSQADHMAPATENEYAPRKSHPQPQQESESGLMDSMGSMIRGGSAAVGSLLTWRWSSPVTSSSTSPVVFGRLLSQLPLVDDLPEFISQILKYLHTTQAWQAEGLFRLNGSHMRISYLRNQWENGIHEVPLTEEPNDVTGLLKRFFRELPEPLITAQYHDQFMDATRGSSIVSDAQLQRLSMLVANLPAVNRAVLTRVVYFLRLVVAAASMNRMTASNIGKTLGPTLLTYSDSITHLGPSVSLMTLMVTEFDSVFGQYVPLPFEADLKVVTAAHSGRRNSKNALFTASPPSRSSRTSGLVAVAAIAQKLRTLSNPQDDTIENQQNIGGSDLPPIDESTQPPPPQLQQQLQQQQQQQQSPQNENNHAIDNDGLQSTDVRSSASAPEHIFNTNTDITTNINTNINTDTNTTSAEGAANDENFLRTNMTQNHNNKHSKNSNDDGHSSSDDPELRNIDYSLETPRGRRSSESSG